MSRGSKVLSVVCVLLSWRSVFAADKPWLEVRSPHFRVITDGSQREANHVAQQFELMRSVFAIQFPGFRLDPPEPLLILAPKDGDSAQALLPQPGGGRYLIAGTFVPGWEKLYVLVRLDTVISDRYDRDIYANIYHEYTHQILHTNFRWLPTWLDEGLAEFYAYTRFERGKMYIGAPPKSLGRFELLDSRESIALPTFIDRRSSLSRDEIDTQLFYAQAWALTHFLTFGPGMEGGARLTRFFNELQRGVKQQKAFENAFGNIDAVGREYENYIQKFAFTTGVLPAPANVDEKDFSARKLSLAETEAELAGFEMRVRRWDQVRRRAEIALADNPKLALAREDMAFVEFNEGKDEEAIKEFSQAVELDGKMYLSIFARLMTSPIARSNSPADQQSLKEGLLRVVEINPQFAAAYVELAKLSVAQGDLSKALALARKAEQLEPFRAGYHLLPGKILAQMGRYHDAAVLAVYVADRWGVPDHDEAMELWNSIPEKQRGTEPPRPPEKPPDWKVAEGTVKSVSCHDKDKERDLVVTLDSGGEARTFHGKNSSTGFSDTLWVGDHFNRCVHVNGLRAVVHYKPSPDKSSAGELINLSFRDDLPVAGKPTTNAAAK